MTEPTEATEPRGIRRRKLTLDEYRQKYSPSQPRSHGRFASGGSHGGGASASATTFSAAPKPDMAEFHKKRVEEILMAPGHAYTKDGVTHSMAHSIQDGMVHFARISAKPGEAAVHSTGVVPLSEYRAHLLKASKRVGPTGSAGRIVHRAIGHALGEVVEPKKAGAKVPEKTKPPAVSSTAELSQKLHVATQAKDHAAITATVREITKRGFHAGHGAWGTGVTHDQAGQGMETSGMTHRALAQNAHDLLRLGFPQGGTASDAVQKLALQHLTDIHREASFREITIDHQGGYTHNTPKPEPPAAPTPPAVHPLWNGGADPFHQDAAATALHGGQFTGELKLRKSDESGINKSYDGHMTMPDGTVTPVFVKVSHNAAYKDQAVAASEVAQVVGLVHTPAVTVRDTPVGHTEVQPMINGLHSHWSQLTPTLSAEDKARLAREESDMGVYDVLIRNNDRKDHNMGYGTLPDGQIHAIAYDHGIAFRPQAVPGAKEHQLQVLFGPAVKNAGKQLTTEQTAKVQRVVDQWPTLEARLTKAGLSSEYVQHVLIRAQWLLSHGRMPNVGETY